MQASVSAVPSSGEVFDEELFDTLRQKYRDGLLATSPLNDIRYAQSADLTSRWPDERHREQGAAAIAGGQVGAAILCGGLATRFGGEPKAAVELVPGWTLLRVKLQALESVASAYNTTLPVLIVVSHATETAVQAILDRHGFAHLRIEMARQSVLPRMLDDGEPLRNADGSMAFNPPGHGEVLKLLARHGQAARIWQISNIDNLLATLDADIVGAHIASGKAATVEVAPGTKEDVGGYLAFGPLGFEILEGFQVAPEGRPKGEFFLSTNTFLVDQEAIAASEKLPYFVATKKTPDDRKAVQFEQLLGSVGAFVPLNAIPIPREGNASRFRPMKVVADLDQSRDALVEALNASGLIEW